MFYSTLQLIDCTRAYNIGLTKLNILDLSDASKCNAAVHQFRLLKQTLSYAAGTADGDQRSSGTHGITEHALSRTFKSPAHTLLSSSLPTGRTSISEAVSTCGLKTLH